MPLDTLPTSQARRPRLERLPSRLHHAAYVSSDQERTRRFYEDVLGLPLIAFWIELEAFEGEPHVLSHAFYGLADGSALAFFNFADPAQAARYAPHRQSLFVHIALNTDQTTQDAIRARLDAATLPYQVIDHGYCVSIYVEDPDGQLIEFTVDSAEAEAIDVWQRRSAHDTLQRWQAGDRATNNDFRPQG